MIETLQTTLAFIVAISILIGVHEFGHFITARKLGVKVEKFSIGFGPPLLSWKSRDGEVTYILAAIPLGGYVKMLGESSQEETIPQEEAHRAFDRQSVGTRAAIAAAGPFFNFLFAILAYMIVAWAGQEVIPPIVGVVEEGSLAERKGILPGDRILNIDGRKVHSWREVEDLLKKKLGTTADLEIDRGGTYLHIALDLPDEGDEPLLMDVSGSLVGFGPGMHVYVGSILPGSPAMKAGLQEGDRIVAVDGKKIRDVQQLIDIVRAHPGRTLEFRLLRGEETVDILITPNADEEGHGKIGVSLGSVSAVPTEIRRMGWVEGIQYGIVRTWEMTVLTVRVLAKMVEASISPQNLGGPIAIAQLAGKTAKLGMVAFISFLALISVNLAVLNLLPIPVLDGGHLVYLGIEKLRGKPLPPKVVERTQAVGIALILILMIFAFYNDLARLFR